MISRTFRYIRYIIAVILVFNAFQGIMIQVDTPGILLLSNSKYDKYAGKFNNRIDAGASVKKVHFVAKKSSDSKELIKRNGILTIRPKAKGTILICHGYMCSKFDVGFLRTFFADYNCLIFDFRAHGEDSYGQLCTMGKDEAYDVMGAVNFIKNHPILGSQKLIGYGFSMGAVSLIEAQAKQKLFDALILDCPFESTESILDKGLENLNLNLFGYTVGFPAKGLIKRLSFNYYTQPAMKVLFKMAGMDATRINTRIDKLNPVESIKKVKVPCLFIHCKNDNRIPVKSIRKLFSHAKGFKSMWLTKGRGHCDSFIYDPEKYKNITNSFLKKFLSGHLFQKDSDQVIDDV